MAFLPLQQRKTLKYCPGLVDHYRPLQPDSEAATEDELAKAKKRIKDLEKQLNARQEDLDLLKKARRFFEKNRH
mgnify:CR=1 FL=1